MESVVSKKWFALPVLAGLVLLGLAFSGCGDLPVNRSMPNDITKVSIPVFTNRTNQPSIEADLTRRTVQEFIVDGRVQVTSPEQAQAELRGTVQRYDRLVLTRDANQVPQQYKLQVLVDLDFVTKKDGVETLLWTTRQQVSLTPGVEPGSDSFDSTNVRSLREFTNYYVLNVAGVPPEDEATALDRLLNQMARRIVRRTLDGF